jgi:hypothetical protein
MDKVTTRVELACREQDTILDGITIGFGSVFWYADFKARTWFCKFLVAEITNP